MLLQVDAVVVVSAPPDVQRERVLARPGMSPGAVSAALKSWNPRARLFLSLLQQTKSLVKPTLQSSDQLN